LVAEIRAGQSAGDGGREHGKFEISGFKKGAKGNYEG
jgi:hypothetical protein